MGILRLSALYITQSKDVWPPSESIQEGKIITEEKLVALYYRQMKGVKDSC